MHKRISLFFLPILILCLTHLSFAQKDNSEALSLGVDAQVNEKEGKEIISIEIKGNKAISTNTIISKMKTRIGGFYQENVISDDLRRLYLLNFFSDIKIDSELLDKGIKVIVVVSERPIIEKISFFGIHRITMKDEKLKGKLKSKEGQYLDYPSLSEDMQILEKMYEKIGYSAAKIEYKLDLNEEMNKVKVNFNIVEGGRVRIKDIIINGNNNITKGRILKLLKTKRAWFFNAGILKDDVLTDDIERIKAFYRREGYIDVAVSYQVVPDAKKPYLLFVNIEITEGNKYLVGDVSIKGNKDISEKDILMRLKECTTGKTFSEEAMRIDLSSMQGLYFDRGYVSANIQESVSLNPQTHRVDITYSILENQVTYVDKIKVRGNIKTKDIVVRREMRLNPGDRFDGEKLRRSKERLTNLGYFEEIGYDTEDTGKLDEKNLIVDVKEAKTGSFSFGGGYSTVDDFVGFVEVEQKNFDWKNWPYFTGAGQNLKLRATIGTITSGFDLSFTEPWLFDYPVSFGFDAYRRTHRRDSDAGYGYDEKTTGGALRLGRELSEYLRGDLIYRIDSVDISNIPSDASADLKAEKGENLISSITPSLTFDSRDNIFDTHKGNLLTTSVEFAGGPLGGDKNYWKFFGRASHYIPLFRNSVLELRGRIGIAEPYGNSEKIPIYERFFAGGAYTIRGYEERKVGPIDPKTKDPLGGASLFVGNVEYVYPLFDFLKIAIFYDIGNVWEKAGGMFSNKDAYNVSNTGGLKSSFGLGFRIKTPIGPIMLDYGIPLDKEPGEGGKSKGRFHFSVSNSF